MTHPSFRLGLVLALLPLTACGGSGGGGGGGGGGGSTGTADLLVTDATVDELLAFRTTIQNLRLVSDSGQPGPDLLAAPVLVDLIAASAAPRWIAREDLPTGTFRGISVSLAPASSTALNRAGTAVAVNQASSAFELFFPAPAVIDASSHHLLVLDFDLALSLSGSVGAPPLAFDPAGQALLATGAAGVSAIDEVHGTVLSVDAPGSSFSMQAFADADRTQPLGQVGVDVAGTTLLLDESAVAFGSAAAFFAALAPGTTGVEVHGVLDGGRITATRIEVEDDGAGGAGFVVKLDGRIENLDTGADTFDLELIEIEKGQSIAGPLIGSATHVAVAYGPTTGIVVSENQPATEGSLFDGQRVHVKFPAFASSPFAASQIEIEQQAEFEGRITGIAGLPIAITIRLDAGEPAITNGQVQSTTTDVTVDLTGGPLFLDTEQEPALATSLLQPGLELELHGKVTGLPASPTLLASRTKVHAGRFRGDAIAVFPVLHSFHASMTDLKDPFGNSVAFGTVSVTLDPACIFSGDTTTEGGFFGLFNSLGGGETLAVEVFGIGNPSTINEILAFEVVATVD